MSISKGLLGVSVLFAAGIILAIEACVLWASPTDVPSVTAGLLVLVAVFFLPQIAKRYKQKQPIASAALLEAERQMLESRIQEVEQMRKSCMRSSYVASIAPKPRRHQEEAASHSPHSV